ncbi:MAG TPA: hypothetical protein VJR29_14325 [bacterium]|nr:hypothetical protein [bacterium]
MNKISTLLIGTLFLSTIPLARADMPALQSSVVAEEKAVQVDSNTILRQISYKGSDPLAVGDPLGNGPVTPKHDAGPPLTQRLSYGPDCQDEACARAMKRWNSPTTWQHDRATGLSIGWGNE